MSDPQADDWGGLSWSGWRAFGQAVTEDWIPSTGGVYRFRSRGEPGLLYVGEGAGRRRRLRTLELHSKAHPARYYLEWPAETKRPHRGHYAAPFLRLCRDAGCVVDVSWANGVHADRADRRAVEARLIRQYHDETHGDPPWQRGGRGMPAYLARHNPGGSAGTSAAHEVVARYFEMWNTGQSPIAQVILHPGWIDHAHPEVTGPDGVRESVDTVRAAQPDLRFRITAILGDGDLVAAVGDVERGPGADPAASQMIWLIWLQGGRMAEMWTYRASP
ncbi:MAG TPA: nuclear transport factor 2 family protein [Streptosporangiaceae bacterium]|nr:nuclear transport factor 2 family protein [Streptosporangiaceae bacterium]